MDHFCRIFQRAALNLVKVGGDSGGDQSQSVQLYNLAEDLSETNNLWDSIPRKPPRGITSLRISSLMGAAQRDEINAPALVRLPLR